MWEWGKRREGRDCNKVVSPKSALPQEQWLTKSVIGWS